MKSMTCYGRFARKSTLGEWLVEIHSVNKKNLDFSIFLPRDFLCFDLDIRKWISAAFRRGQVTVKVTFSPHEAVIDVDAQIKWLKPAKEGMETICRAVDCDPKDITFPFLYGQLEAHRLAFPSKTVDLTREDLHACVSEAVQACLEMRQKEGLALAKAMEESLGVIKAQLLVVEQRSVGCEDRYRKKILDKLQELNQVLKIDEERLLKEAFFYAEKADIAEEIARLQSHLVQSVELLRSKEENLGKAMDFLLQEMGREVNTIAAKSDDLEVSYAALKMKAEIEKMREQVQNIE